LAIKSTADHQGEVAEKTYYHNFGYQAFYLRKGEKTQKSLLPQATTYHQEENAEKTYYHNFGYQAFYLGKGEKSLFPQSTTDHQGEVAEKGLVRRNNLEQMTLF
jgi:hypothetical protein